MIFRYLDILYIGIIPGIYPLYPPSPPTSYFKTFLITPSPFPKLIIPDFQQTYNKKKTVILSIQDTSLPLYLSNSIVGTLSIQKDVNTSLTPVLGLVLVLLPVPVPVLVPKVVSGLEFLFLSFSLPHSSGCSGLARLPSSNSKTKNQKPKIRVDFFSSSSRLLLLFPLSSSLLLLLLFFSISIFLAGLSFYNLFLFLFLIILDKVILKWNLKKKKKKLRLILKTSAMGRFFGLLPTYEKKR